MIFVSFRDESAHSAGRLAHLLGDRFGPAEVFLADSVVVGADAATATDSALRQCTAGIVLVDPMWTAAGPVIQQIRTLLARGIEVLPVLVDGARPPRADDLPESVRGLARLQAVRLDHLTFRSDAEQVADWADTVIRGEPPPRPRRPRVRRHVSPDRPVSPLRMLWRIALWWMVFIFAIPAGIGVFRLMLGRDEPRGATTALAIDLVLLGGWTLALRREIVAQRLMIGRAGPDASTSSAGRAVSRGHVRLITGVCVVVCVLIGWSLAGLR